MFGRVTCVTALQAPAVQQTALRNVTAIFFSKRNATAAATQAVEDELSTAKPYEAIPGPKPSPIIGNAWRFIPGLGKYKFSSLLFSTVVARVLIVF